MAITHPQIKLFVVCHKETPVLNTEVFTPIQVGRKNATNLLNMIGDDSGDNISDRNQLYCEVTAIYWAWKNSQADWKGICHYRRIFDFNAESLSSQNGLTYALDENAINKFGWTDERIRDVCSTCDIIIPRLYFFPNGETNYQAYSRIHHERDLIATIEVLRRYSPEHSYYLDRVLYRSYAHYLSMILAKKEIFDAYAEWLYGLLTKIEPLINIDFTNGYQRRALAFLAERLTSAYIEKLIDDGKKVKELAYVYCDFDYVTPAPPPPPAPPTPRPFASRLKIYQTAAQV